MRGEGFDLPELKIAAFHDIRISLAVTLQLAGRFTRASPDLGDPVFIANIALVDEFFKRGVRGLTPRDKVFHTLKEVQNTLVVMTATDQGTLAARPVDSWKTSTSCVGRLNEAPRGSPIRDGGPICSRTCSAGTTSDCSVDELEPLHRRGGSPRSAAIAPRGCAQAPCIPTPIDATGL